MANGTTRFIRAINIVVNVIYLRTLKHPNGEAILNPGIEYGIFRRHANLAQDHRRGAAGASRKGTTGQRQRHHPDRSYRPATGRGVACLRAPAPTTRQGSFHPHVRRVEGRSMIAVDTSTWIGFLEGEI